MRPLNFSRALTAGRVALRYLAVAPHQPGLTRQFAGSILHYIATYDHRVIQPPHLPERRLHEILPGIEDCEVCLTHKVEPKSLPYGEAYVLAAITAYLRPRTVFEIGTFTGGATLIMARHAGPQCRVYTLDLPPGERLSLPGLEHDPPEAAAARIGERFRGTHYARQITQLYGDSATFDFSPYIGQMDLVLVDGAHSYEYVMNDTRRALQMLSPTGTIIWDDCSTMYPGVVRALDRLGARYSIFRIASTRLALHTRAQAQAVGQVLSEPGVGE